MIFCSARCSGGVRRWLARSYSAASTTPITTACAHRPAAQHAAYGTPRAGNWSGLRRPSRAGIMSTPSDEPASAPSWSGPSFCLAGPAGRHRSASTKSFVRSERRSWPRRLPSCHRDVPPQCTTRSDICPRGENRSDAEHRQAEPPRSSPRYHGPLHLRLRVDPYRTQLFPSIDRRIVPRARLDLKHLTADPQARRRG